MRPRHLLTVWNPTYASGALADHVTMLLEWCERHRRVDAETDDLRYVWWGKVRSPNREGALAHLRDVLAIQEQIEAGTETHLYLTDYRSLYVAELDEITDDDVPTATELELAHMPAYYREYRVDVWFRLLDIRRIIADDTVAVIQELQRLNNTRYHDRPVSIYGGMVELPLIVTRADDAAWFRDRAAVTGDRLWVEHDRDTGGEAERLARDLRDNVLGAAVWSQLDLATRGFLASAEATFRSRRDDPHFDFSGPAVSYAKAVETELNALLFERIARVLARAKPADRVTTVDGRRLDLGERVAHQSLGAIHGLLSRDEVFGKAVRTAFPHDRSWLVGELPSHLKGIVDLRNAAAHSASTSRIEVSAVRDLVLGIGLDGLMTRLARIRMRVG